MKTPKTNGPKLSRLQLVAARTVTERLAIAQREYGAVMHDLFNALGLDSAAQYRVNLKTGRVEKVQA